jgi:hypothetical protein
MYFCSFFYELDKNFGGDVQLVYFPLSTTLAVQLKILRNSGTKSHEILDEKKIKG